MPVLESRCFWLWRWRVSHGARSCANLSTALAGTNLSLSLWHRRPRPRLSVRPSSSSSDGRYENTLEKIYCPLSRPSSASGLSFDFVPLWTTGPFKSLIGLFIAKRMRARFFAPPRLDTLAAQSSVLNPLLPPASPIPPAETLRADFAKGGFCWKSSADKGHVRRISYLNVNVK